MVKHTLLAATILAVLAGPALASRCPKDMAAIDAALAQNPAVSEAQLAEAKKLRAEGEALHKAGSHAESEAALAKAKEILGVQ